MCIRDSHHGAVPRAGCASALFLEWLGCDTARDSGLLRPALQHRLLRTGETGPRELSGGPLMVRHRPAFRRARAAVAVWLLSVSVVGAQQPTNFVSCPIVRDTASVPCWLAEYDGELYFLTLQTDVSAPVTPPWLGHRVLVEGTVSDEPRICGGVVLKPVHLSVLDRDASCTTMLPAEERYNLTFEPPRPPGPSRGRLAFGDPTPRNAAADAGSANRSFTLQYEFDGMVVFRHAQILQQILDAARAGHA